MTEQKDRKTISIPLPSVNKTQLVLTVLLIVASFFIGKSSADGVITGTKIVGAQPFSVFQAEIDTLLK